VNARRLVVAVAVIGALLLGSGSTALADPAGPTDYRSEVVSVDPPIETISMRVLGGDSFVELEVVPGSEAMVMGYQGEDYLWFRPDGTVLENRNAPTTYTNEDRYGGGEIPPTATAVAEPAWQEVATGHRYAWHDHRAHWMQQSPPLGLGPGDQILEANIPLVVDGREVDVAVISTWVASPSAVPLALGAVLGALAAVGVWLLGRRVPSPAERGQVAVARVVVVLPVVLAAVVAGWWQYWSLPSETGPKLTWWLLPSIAAVCLLVALIADLVEQPFVAQGAMLLVGAELFVWGLVKRDGLGAALIPTDAPGWFDRLATTAALVGGAGIAAVTLVLLFTTPRNLRPASR
jgi:hypothetical protein